MLPRDLVPTLPAVGDMREFIYISFSTTRHCNKVIRTTHFRYWWQVQTQESPGWGYQMLWRGRRRYRAVSGAFGLPGVDSQPTRTASASIFWENTAEYPETGDVYIVEKDCVLAREFLSQYCLYTSIHGTLLPLVRLSLAFRIFDDRNIWLPCWSVLSNL